MFRLDFFSTIFFTNSNDSSAFEMFCFRFECIRSECNANFLSLNSPFWNENSTSFSPECLSIIRWIQEKNSFHAIWMLIQNWIFTTVIPYSNSYRWLQSLTLRSISYIRFEFYQFPPKWNEICLFFWMIFAYLLTNWINYQTMDSSFNLFCLSLQKIKLA